VIEGVLSLPGPLHAGAGMDELSKLFADAGPCWPS
jgi:hypothetical protein